MSHIIRNVVLEPITLAISTTDVAVTPAAFGYKSNGKVHLASAYPATVSLAPAFVASTEYLKGEQVYQAGSYYTAKQTFTSGAAFNAADWNLLEAGVLAATEYRWYAIGVRKSAAGATVARVLAFEKGLIANGFDLPSETPDVVDSAAFTVIGFVLVYGAVTPGATTLTTGNSKFVQAYGNNGSEK